MDFKEWLLNFFISSTRQVINKAVVRAYMGNNTKVIKKNLDYTKLQKPKMYLSPQETNLSIELYHQKTQAIKFHWHGVFWISRRDRFVSYLLATSHPHNKALQQCKVEATHTGVFNFYFRAKVMEQSQFVSEFCIKEHSSLESHEFALLWFILNNPEISVPLIYQKIGCSLEFNDLKSCFSDNQWFEVGDHAQTEIKLSKILHNSFILLKPSYSKLLFILNSPDIENLNFKNNPDFIQLVFDDSQKCYLIKNCGSTTDVKETIKDILISADIEPVVKEFALNFAKLQNLDISKLLLVSEVKSAENLDISKSPSISKLVSKESGFPLDKE